MELHETIEHTGRILHLDGDRRYSDKALKQYKKLGLNAVVKNMGSDMGLNGGISYIPPWLALASLVFAILVGMIAGFFPSLRAMKLSPLAAIRNE